ncbi:MULTISPECIES: alpha/beta hydrolase [unclassified Rhizobium]|uniref:alpha/beta hydrolase n=1 Tax=unclassified Rhizobium TaxID=2613769 RepID=UPI001AE2BB90|nr:MULTISPECIES: alpha/beta hydrolase [unclassified Rhizobium]MBP2463653.1 putative esterase [Rhizobium sp. PvP014]MBP2532175.1 putative esterase [Rhizobium sp. PvP099]
MQELGTSGAAARAREIYDYGQTAIFASTADPRLHMLLYVPPTAADGRRIDLLVAVHGTGRTSAIDFRDGFAEFGLYNDCAILCPIFPMNVLGDGARSGYKFMEEGDIRYDRIVLSMVEEMAAKYDQDWSKFAIFGFSGGGHFAHRFAILHPERLWAASVGAPGSVTLLDPERDWWVGVRDLEIRFGKTFDAEALAKVPVHMVVGDADLETWEITHKPGSKYYMEGANDAGENRPARLEALADSFRAAGVDVTFEKVAGVSHDRIKVLGHVKAFLAKILNERRMK